MNTSIQLYINTLSKKLEDHGYAADHAQQIVWWIIEAVTKTNQLQFITNNKEISLKDREVIADHIDRHIHQTYPLQYIFKTVPFAGLQLCVEPPVLIPRPETEEWVIHLIDQFTPLKNEELQILDMCTGSGCIGLTLASAFEQSKITLVDVAQHALNLAHKNMIAYKLSNVSIVPSDLYTNLSHDQKFDLIVSNPPYITSAEWEKLEPVVQRWEDKKALEAGDDGLSLIKPLVQEASVYLKSTSVLDEYRLPRLVIEIGYMQGAIVKQLCLNAGFKRVDVVKDFAGCDRIVVCYQS